MVRVKNLSDKVVSRKTVNGIVTWKPDEVHEVAEPFNINLSPELFLMGEISSASKKKKKKKNKSKKKDLDQFDVDGDGKITFKDVISVAKNIGKKTKKKK